MGVSDWDPRCEVEPEDVPYLPPQHAQAPQGARLTEEREAEIRRTLQNHERGWAAGAAIYSEDLTLLLAEIDALRALLAPFAAYADVIASDQAAAPYPDTCPLGVSPTSQEERPTLGDCRRARKALKR